MRAEGRYGIGVVPGEAPTRIRGRKTTESSVAVTPAEQPSVPPSPPKEEPPSIRSPKHKWSFGSLDKAFAGGDQFTIDSSRPNGVDYTGTSAIEGRGRSYSPSGEGGHMNGYSRRGVRRLSRGGGYGRGTGPYMGNNPRGGYRNGASYAPPPQQPMYPPYDSYGPPPMMPYEYGAPPPPDPFSPATPTEYPQVPMPYYHYPPPGYPPPMPYYGGYMPQNGMLYGPTPPPFPPPVVPYGSGPPVPAPATQVGYIDPFQYSLLGQVCGPARSKTI